MIIDGIVLRYFKFSDRMSYPIFHGTTVPCILSQPLDNIRKRRVKLEHVIETRNKRSVAFLVLETDVPTKWSALCMQGAIFQYISWLKCIAFWLKFRWCLFVTLVWWFDAYTYKQLHYSNTYDKWIVIFLHGIVYIYMWHTKHWIEKKQAYRRHTVSCSIIGSDNDFSWGPFY